MFLKTKIPRNLKIMSEYFTKIANNWLSSMLSLFYGQKIFMSKVGALFDMTWKAISNLYCSFEMIPQSIQSVLAQVYSYILFNQPGKSQGLLSNHCRH